MAKRGKASDQPLYSEKDFDRVESRYLASPNTDLYDLQLFDSEKKVEKIWEEALTSARHAKLKTSTSLPWEDSKLDGRLYTNKTELLMGKQEILNTFFEEAKGPMKQAYANKLAKVNLKIEIMERESKFHKDFIKWFTGEGTPEEYSRCWWYGDQQKKQIAKLYADIDTALWELRNSADADKPKKRTKLAIAIDTYKEAGQTNALISGSMLHNRNSSVITAEADKALKAEIFKSSLERLLIKNPEEAYLYYRYVVDQRSASVTFKKAADLHAYNWWQTDRNPGDIETLHALVTKSLQAADITPSDPDVVPPPGSDVKVEPKAPEPKETPLKTIKPPIPKAEEPEISSDEEVNALLDSIKTPEPKVVKLFGKYGKGKDLAKEDSAFKTPKDSGKKPTSSFFAGGKKSTPSKSVKHAWEEGYQLPDTFETYDEIPGWDSLTWGEQNRLKRERKMRLGTWKGHEISTLSGLRSSLGRPIKREDVPEHLLPAYEAKLAEDAKSGIRPKPKKSQPLRTTLAPAGPPGTPDAPAAPAPGTPAPAATPQRDPKSPFIKTVPNQINSPEVRNWLIDDYDQTSSTVDLALAASHVGEDNVPWKISPTETVFPNGIRIFKGGWTDLGYVKKDEIQGAVFWQAPDHEPTINAQTEKAINDVTADLNTLGEEEVGSVDEILAELSRTDDYDKAIHDLNALSTKIAGRRHDIIQAYAHALKVYDPKFKDRNEDTVALEISRYMERKHNLSLTYRLAATNAVNKLERRKRMGAIWSQDLADLIDDKK